MKLCLIFVAISITIWQLQIKVSLLRHAKTYFGPAASNSLLSIFVFYSRIPPFYMVHKISWVNLIKINGLLMIKVWVSKFLDFKSIYGERDKIFALPTLFAGISHL